MKTTAKHRNCHEYGVLSGRRTVLECGGPPPLCAWHVGIQRQGAGALRDASRLRPLLMCLCLFATLALCSCGPKPPPNLDKMRGRAAIVDNDPWPDKMEKLAEQQVMDAWTNYHVPLDFSIKSIQAEDKLLGMMAQSEKFRALSAKEQKTSAFIAGAYLGEVFRRNLNGVWGVNSGSGGLYSFPVIMDNSYEVFPCMWCLKRLVNGSGDNIWRKYVIYIVRHTNEVAAVSESVPLSNAPPAATGSPATNPPPP